MNVLETLLALDKNKLALPTKVVEVKRLSEVAGKPVIFVLQGLTQERVQSIREMATKMNPDTKESEMDFNEIRLATIAAGVKEPNLRDKNLLEYYGVPTPYELIKKLLLPGEIDALYEQISILTGFDEKVVQEVKN
jgi:Phage XkdN-like tail assembly chaperone protein, TAC